MLRLAFAGILILVVPAAAQQGRGTIFGTVVALFLTPLVAVVPSEAATPALVVVGALMLTQVRNLDLDDFSLAVPAFLTMVLMPFTFSITVGIGAGVVSYVVLRSVRGLAREIHPLLWVVAAAFVLYFAIDPVKSLLGVA